MTTQQSDFLWGTSFLIVGVLLLTYTDQMVALDQKSGIKMRAFFRKNLGDSILNRELWRGETSRASRTSRIAFRFAGLFSILAGITILFLTLRAYFL